MRKKSRDPFVPAEKQDTIRHEIVALLRKGELSAKEISMETGISEKEVPGHLEHIRIMLHRGGIRFLVHAASCGKCGFVFAKRERLTKPGKCPVCLSEKVKEPRFSIG